MLAWLSVFPYVLLSLYVHLVWSCLRSALNGQEFSWFLRFIWRECRSELFCCVGLGVDCLATDALVARYGHAKYALIERQVPAAVCDGV